LNELDEDKTSIVDFLIKMSLIVIDNFKYLYIAFSKNQSILMNNSNNREVLKANFQKIIQTEVTTFNHSVSRKW